jgi:hypothetical protein
MADGLFAYTDAVSYGILIPDFLLIPTDTARWRRKDDMKTDFLQANDVKLQYFERDSQTSP